MARDSKMKMIVVGDSYATNYSPLSWTAIVDKYFNADTFNMAKPATSFYYSFNNLSLELERNNIYDVVIFVITSTDRLYHSEYILHGGFPQHFDGKPVSKAIKRSIESYYTYLYDVASNDIACKIYMHALTSLSLEYPNTKFIFIPAFNNINFRFKNGNCVITDKRLLDYSMLDVVAHQMEFLGKPIERNNHLTYRQNQTLAETIIKIIENYKFNEIEYKTLEGMEKL